MGILAGVLILLSLVSFISAVVGVIAPSLFKNRKTGEVPKRVHLFVGGFVGSVVAMAIAGIVAPDKAPTSVDQKALAQTEKQPESASPPSAIAPAAPATPDKSLGMTPEVFRKAFNTIVAKIDRDNKLAEFDIEQGDVRDAFRRTLGPSIALVGTVNKEDGSIRDLMVIAGGGDAHDTIKSIAVLLSATQAVNPDVPAKKNNSTVVEMVRFAMEHMKNPKPIERTVGKLDYTASASQATGLLFAISSH